jgi:hypothetical protein
VNYSELSDEELSRAVAERLGWKWDDEFVCAPDGKPCKRAVKDYTTHYSSPKWGQKIDGLMLILPAFATDIGAAWGLVERMNRGVNISVSTELKETYVHVDGVNQGFYHAAAGVAKTAPRAICLAFLDTEVKK